MERQIWTNRTILTYWFCDLISIVSWSQASAMYAVGLSATDATLACLVAGICISFPIGKYLISVWFCPHGLYLLTTWSLSHEWKDWGNAAYTLSNCYSCQLWNIPTLLLCLLSCHIGAFLVWNPFSLRWRLYVRSTFLLYINRKYGARREGGN